MNNDQLDQVTLITPPPIGGRGIVIERFLSLIVSFFVSLSARLRENGWTDLHEIFREGVECPWDDLIKFWVNSSKPRDAAMLGAGFVVRRTTACLIDSSILSWLTQVILVRHGSGCGALDSW